MTLCDSRRSAHILNHTGPTKVTDKMPYELWTGRQAPVDHLKIFRTQWYTCAKAETTETRCEVSQGICGWLLCYNYVATVVLEVTIT